MKKSLYPLFILLVTCNFAIAQKKKHINSMLWKIEYPKTGSKSYILGTNHFLGNSWLTKFSFLQDLINASDLIYAESGEGNTDKSKSDTLKTGNAKTVGYFFGKDSIMVDSFYSAYLKIPLSKFISPKSTIPNNGLEMQKMFLNGLDALIDIKFNIELSNQYGLRKDTFNASKIESLDYLLKKSVKTKGKTITGLDNDEYINNMFDESPLGTKEMISKIKNIDQYYKGISTEYDKNLKTSLELLYKGLKDYTESYTTKLKDADSGSLINRNNMWANRLKEELKSKNAFIAVGLGHLFFRNKYGVIDILRKNGYKVTPVNMLEHAHN